MPDMPGLIARPRFMRLHDEYLNASRDRIFVSGSLGNVRPETLELVGSAILNAGRGDQ